MKTLLALALVASTLGVTQPAAAATDRKVLSGLVCVATGQAQLDYPVRGTVAFRGLLYSCSGTDHVSAANEAASCPSVGASSDPDRLAEDIDFINPALPMGEDQVLIFRVTLFPNTVLKSLIDTENN